MECKVRLLVWSAYSFKPWDMESPTEDSEASPENTFCTTVEAATHQEAFSKAYEKMFGVVPPAEKVELLPNCPVVNGKVTFFVGDDFLP